MNSKQERRYMTRRWKALRADVLRRDLYRCQVVAGCPIRATICDHIEPVYQGMPDWEFYDPLNLRAACLHHNTARGVAARLRRELGSEDAPVRRSRFAYGGEGRPRRASIF